MLFVGWEDFLHARRAVPRAAEYGANQTHHEAHRWITFASVCLYRPLLSPFILCDSLSHSILHYHPLSSSVISTTIFTLASWGPQVRSWADGVSLWTVTKRFTGRLFDWIVHHSHLIKVIEADIPVICAVAVTGQAKSHQLFAFLPSSSSWSKSNASWGPQVTSPPLSTVILSHTLSSPFILCHPVSASVILCHPYHSFIYDLYDQIDW